MSKKILLTDDLSTTTKNDKRRRLITYAWASYIAKLLHTKMDMIHSENIHQFPIQNYAYTQFFQKWIKKRTSTLKHSKAASHSFLVEGSPVDNILKFAKRTNDYELIVVGTHGRVYLNRLLLGSVSEEIIRHSKIPVMTIGTSVYPPKNTKGVAKILVATDLGVNSRNAEKYALTLAKKMDAQVVLVHCLFEGIHPVLQTAFSSPSGNRRLVELYETITKETKIKLEHAQKKFTKAGVSCKTVLDVKTNSAAKSILKLSENMNSVLIVLGTHGRNYIASTLLGSTARQTILQAHRPVITVRSRS